MPTEPQALLDTRTGEQRDYDLTHTHCMNAFFDAMSYFEWLQALRATLEGGDSRVAAHVTVKASVQSISDHIKDTILVKDGVTQDLAQKSAAISAL